MTTPRQPPAGPLEAVSGGTQEGLGASAAPPRSPERIHELKCWPQYFDLILSGAKTFEARWNDRQFRVGDALRLREWIRTPESDGGARDTPIEFPGIYTGRETRRTVTYILESDAFGIAPGWAILALAPWNATPKEAPTSPDSPSQGERKQQPKDQDRAPSARPWSEVRAEHSKLSEGERATIDKAVARILEVEEQLRRSEQRNASYRASKEHLSGMYGERCAEIRQLQRDKAALVDALAREHAAYLDARTGNAGASPPPALPSSPSSASLESGGGTLDTNKAEGGASPAPQSEKR